MDKLKPCPCYKGLCHVEIIQTLAPPPRNIRIGCEMHGVWLPDSYESVEKAIEAWNRRKKDE